MQSVKNKIFCQFNIIHMKFFCEFTEDKLNMNIQFKNHPYSYNSWCIIELKGSSTSRVVVRGSL